MVITDSARKQAQELGLTEEQLGTIVKYCVPFTHPDGTHRFESYLLTVDGDDLVEVVTFNPHQLTRVVVERVRKGGPVKRKRIKPRVYVDTIECKICKGTRTVMMDGTTVPCPKGQNPNLDICE